MEQIVTKKSNKFLDAIRNNKKIQIIIVISCLIICLFILFANFNGSKNKQTTSASNNYIDLLEEKLSRVLSQVEGAGKVSVIINVESGSQTVIATTTSIMQTNSGVEKTETPILVNGKPVVLKELNPNIVGVLIVAEGGKDILTLTRLQQATMSLLDININQIEILSMK